MPPADNITKEFLKGVFNEEKDLIPMSELRLANMPRYDEISVKNVWPEVRKFPEVMKYLPNSVRKGAQLNRAYFFNVLNTVMPEYCSKLASHAHAQRNRVDFAGARKDCIEISEAWYEKLMSLPYTKSKFTFPVTNCCRVEWQDGALAEG